MKELNIRFLDHVAILVKDLEASANWYQEVLGLRKYQPEKWGEFPIFMLAGRSGLALFPADTEAAAQVQLKSVDHFAFNVDYDNFKIAQERLTQLGIAYEFKDHHYFHSIYFQDPDNHRVELTTIMIDEATFYE